MPATHETFDAEDGVFGIGNLLVLGGLADEAFAFFGETDHGRGQPAALGIDQHLGLIAFHDGNTTVGCTQIDSYDFCHESLLIQRKSCALINATSTKGKGCTIESAELV